MDSEPDGTNIPDQPGELIVDNPQATKNEENTRETAKTKKSGKSSGLKRLTLRNRQLLINYLSPDSPTYDNKTRSYMAAYGNSNPQSSATIASQQLSKPHMQAAINTILSKSRLQVQDRVDLLSSFAHGVCTPRKVKRQVIDKTGEIIDLTDSYEPTFTERLKAIDQVNKLAGDYDLGRLRVKETEDAHKLIKSRLLKQLQTDIEQTVDDTVKDLTDDPSEQGKREDGVG
jgi:hypothetical protein